MSWIKVKNGNNKIFTVPESVFKNSYEGCGVFTRVEEPKAQNATKPKTVKSEVKENGESEIQFTEQVEVDTKRKNSKKASV